MKTGKFKTEDEYLREEAIRFLVSHMPRSASDKKPVILHSLRVGTYLQNMGCSLDSVIGGYLHDLIEDSSITADHISENFGNNIATIVLTNSKDPTIAKEKRLEDCIKRCKQYGIDALYVKAADIIDNYNFYTHKKSKSEKLRASKQGSYLLEVIRNETYSDDHVFKNLENIIKV